jgi:hypothetical protein
MAKKIRADQVARSKKPGRHADAPRTGNGRTGSHKPDGVSFRSAGGAEVGSSKGLLSRLLSWGNK